MNAKLITRNLHTNNRIWPRRKWWNYRMRMTYVDAHLGVVHIANFIPGRPATAFHLED